MIKIPIEIGDVLRVGRFKNKRITVKSITYDKYGLPMVNGRPLLTARIEKLIKKDEQVKESSLKLKHILKEMGEGVRPYYFGIDYDTDVSVQYGFDTDKNVEYQVSFDLLDEAEADAAYSHMETWDVSFAAREIGKGQSFDTSIITNKGDVFKVMSTVIATVKDFLNDHDDVGQLRFDPSQTGSDPNTKRQRAQLYLAFIKKQFPQAKVVEDDDIFLINL